MSKADGNEAIHSKTKQTINRILGDGGKSAEQQGIKIPKFNLAEDILAEQRKMTSIRRKAPGRKIETPDFELEFVPAGFAIEQSKPTIFEQEQIIAEIVARDIEMSYSSSTF